MTQSRHNIFSSPQKVLCGQSPTSTPLAAGNEWPDFCPNSFNFYFEILYSLGSCREGSCTSAPGPSNTNNFRFHQCLQASAHFKEYNRAIVCKTGGWSKDMEGFKEVQGGERTEGNIPGEQALFDEQFVWVFKLILFSEKNSPIRQDSEQVVINGRARPLIELRKCFFQSWYPQIAMIFLPTLNSNRKKTFF